VEEKGGISETLSKLKKMKRPKCFLKQNKKEKKRKRINPPKWSGALLCVYLKEFKRYFVYVVKIN